MYQRIACMLHTARKIRYLLTYLLPHVQLLLSLGYSVIIKIYVQLREIERGEERRGEERREEKRREESPIFSCGKVTRNSIQQRFSRLNV